jgi:hypothetical protein
MRTVAFGRLRLTRLPVYSAGRPCCGDLRRSLLRGGDLRGAIPARDMCGIDGKPAVYPAKNMPICRYLTGATGLEPATSGVTGRSWRNRAE